MSGAEASGALAEAAEAEHEADMDAREADYDRFVRRNLKRNFAAHFAHGMLGRTGFRLIGAPTFIPAYLFAISGSTTLVGLGPALRQLGAVLSPVIGATHIEHRKRVMPVAVVMGLGMRLPLLAMALAGWFTGGTVLIVATLALLFVFGFFAGSQRVVFQMLLGKVIPIERRGTLQAWRNFAGGIVAAALSYYAGSRLIDQQVLGNGYATTFAISFVLTTIGLFVLVKVMVEPEPPTVRHRSGVVARLREVPALFEDRDFRSFIGAQSLAMTGKMSLPFCILYVGQQETVSGAVLGLLTMAFLGADTLSNLIWGKMGDRGGFRIAFLLAVVTWIASLLLLIEGRGLIVHFIVFAGLGMANSGYMLSAQTLVLEFGARDDVPMRLALSATAETSMSALGPLAGGVIAQQFGYVPLFWCSIAFLIAGATLLLRMRDPRFRNAVKE